MKIFSISDLHLSNSVDKPMDIFGPGWEGHFDKIKADWLNKVEEDDVVLLCGDTSWGTVLEEGISDLNTLKGLPGKKVFIRGNHDFWWNGISKLRAAAPDESFYFLQNDCVKFSNIIICGSRGWSCPGAADFCERDEKLYLREAERFKLCFKEVEKIRREGDVLLAMIHFPPMNTKLADTLFTDIFKENKVDKVIFGHVHGQSYFPFRTVKDGIEYVLTSCDKVGFTLQRIY